jgi:flagellar basal-body rod protein FlgC
MGMYDSVEVSASGLSAERLAMDVIANNLANVNTTRTPEGGAFKRQLVMFQQKADAGSAAQATTAGGPSATAANTIDNDGVDMDSLDVDTDLFGPDLNRSRAGVQVVGITQDNGPDKLVYDPGHPDADAQGYVHMPNVDVVKEMVDMMAAQRAYEANVTAIQESRNMGNAAQSLLKS